VSLAEKWLIVRAGFAPRRCPGRTLLPLRNVSLALGLALAGCASGQPPLCSPAETQRGCAVATQLFLGLSRSDGSAVSEAAWQAFLADVATPLFPAGFTIIVAQGQWRQDGTASIIREPSRVLVIVHSDPADEDRIAALIASYKTRFVQQSVLRLGVKSITRF
jgi:hypothetical protein